MKIAIIGGAGFVGTYLARLLREKNYLFSILDVSPSESVQFFDVTKCAAVDLAGYDRVINLAAVHRDDVTPFSKYHDVNVEGARRVCEAATASNVNQIIFTSSVAIYGFAPPNTGEEGEANYFNEYGKTKYLAEQIFFDWQREDPTCRSLVVVRPTVIFGEGNRGNVYNLLKQISLGRFVMLGNGENRKSMAYVENVAAFLEYSLSFKSGLHIYNYIDKPDFDMNSLVSEVRRNLFGKDNVGLRLPALLGIAIGYFADFVAKITRKTFPVSRIRVQKFMSTTQFSSAVDETGFIPPVSLEEGLARTLRYEFLEDNSDKLTFDTE